MAKIAVVGSFGVGKTTLANQLAKELKHQLLPEVARMMIEDGHRLDLEVTPKLELLMAEMQEDLEKGEDWVADRCLIDILAYSMVLFKDDKLLNDINDRLCRAKYDILLYIPPEFPIDNDGVRSTDVGFQKKIDDKILHILKDYPFYIITGTREKRLKDSIKIYENSRNSKPKTS